MVNLLRFILGTRCLDCGDRHRSDVCPTCFAKRTARAERCDSRVIAHPEEDWTRRLSEMERARWAEQGVRRKTRMRAVR